MDMAEFLIQPTCILLNKSEKKKLLHHNDNVINKYLLILISIHNILSSHQLSKFQCTQRLQEWLTTSSD